MNLAAIFKTVPPDVAAYFGHVSDGSLTDHEELELNLLPVSDAVRWTKDFLDFHPVVSFFRGVILDNPHSSNHHVYLSESCCSGAVLYLTHDGDSQIVFPTLAAFLDAARRALRTSQSLTAFHPVTGVQLADQKGLSELITGLLDGEFDCDCGGVVVALVPSLDLTDLAQLGRLAKDDALYVAEAVGDAIARRPRSDLAAVAETCQRHKHPQAAAAARQTAALGEKGCTCMSRRAIGLSLLNISGLLVIAGALYDLLVPSVPQNHLAYLGATDKPLDPQYAQLDLAMLRSIGGCLLAIGVTTLVLTSGPIRRGETWARFTVAILVGVSEGNNAYRMFPFHSPWYGPLGFAVLAVAGAVLVGNGGSSARNAEVASSLDLMRPPRRKQQLEACFLGLPQRHREISCSICYWVSVITRLTCFKILPRPCIPHSSVRGTEHSPITRCVKRSTDLGLRQRD